MKNSTIKTSRSNRSIPDRCLPALVAVGGSLATLPVGALELGELTVQSRLGQPLRASIAYALAPTERISDVCVTMRPGASLSGLPGIGAAKITVANGVILLVGNTPIREPMVSAHLVVNCPYSANLSREYMAFIDPAPTVDEPVYRETAVTQQASRRAEPVAVAPAPVEPTVPALVEPAAVAEPTVVAERPAATTRPAPVSEVFEVSTRYQVQRGDTLSEIASRIQDRPVGLWAAVNAIFEANPNSFVNNDVNRLKAGSWLDIPSFDGSATVVADVDPAVAEFDTAEAGPADSGVEIYEPSFSTDTTTIDETQFVAEFAAADSVAIEPEAADAASADANGTSAVVLDDLSSTESTPIDVIPDTELPGPTTSSTSPNVTTAVVATTPASESSGGSTSWLTWLAGIIVAVAFGLMMFRRRSSGLTDTGPEAPVAADGPLRRFDNDQPAEAQNIDEIDEVEDECIISDESPTEENLILEADLLLGTELKENSSTDISDGFKFAEDSKLDDDESVDATSEVPAASQEASPVPTVEVSTLDAAIMSDMTDLSNTEDDIYDMSVIVDTKKMPVPDGIQDLNFEVAEHAIADETKVMETVMEQDSASYHVLEQDYEDEMTATQALNLEIAHAAAELSAKKEIDVLDSADDETSALPLATVTELDVTAQMSVKTNEELSLEGDDETATARIAIDEDTMEMPAKNGKAR